MQRKVDMNDIHIGLLLRVQIFEDHLSSAQVYRRHSRSKFSLDLKEDMCNLIRVYPRTGGGWKMSAFLGINIRPLFYLSQLPFLTPPHISPGKLIFGKSRQEDKEREREIRERRKQ